MDFNNLMTHILLTLAPYFYTLNTAMAIYIYRCEVQTRQLSRSWHPSHGLTYKQLQSYLP